MATGVGPIAASVAFVGGLLPDPDVRLRHRTWLHYPAHYGVLTAAFPLAATAFDSPFAVPGSYLFGAAALHWYTDYLVAVQKPSDETGADGVVYLHPADRWIGPLEAVRYAGSPGDLLVGVLLAVPPFSIYDGVPFGLTVLAVVRSVLHFAKRQYRRVSDAPSP